MKKQLILATILALASVGALAADAPAGLQPRQSDSGIAYISGGIGADERDALSAQAGDYNLRLVFADKSGGHYLSDIKVAIRSAKGADMLEAVADGPWFFAKLPPGAYRVSATAGEQRQTRSVTVGKQRQSRLAFHFDVP